MNHYKPNTMAMNVLLELKCFRLMKEHGNVLASKIILSFLNDASLHFSNFQQSRIGNQ